MENNDKNENKPLSEEMESDGFIKDDNRIEAAELKVWMPVSKKLENFWYHYKWHTIAAIFVLVVAVVLIVQCAAKPKYDIHILYVGDKAISTSKSNPERQQFLNAFGSVTSDFDDSGDVNVAFKHLYQPDAEEIARLEALEKEGKGEVPDSLIYEDKNTFDDLMANSEYYLLFLDKAVFDSCGMIMPIDSVLPSGFSGEIVRNESGGSGIYLRDTGFYKLEGISTLPDDTVICIKLANAFATDDDLELQKEAIEVFKRIALT